MSIIMSINTSINIITMNTSNTSNNSIGSWLFNIINNQSSSGSSLVKFKKHYGNNIAYMYALYHGLFVKNFNYNFKIIDINTIIYMVKTHDDIHLITCTISDLQYSLVDYCKLTVNDIILECMLFWLTYDYDKTPSEIIPSDILTENTVMLLPLPPTYNINQAIYKLLESNLMYQLVEIIEIMNNMIIYYYVVRIHNDIYLFSLTPFICTKPILINNFSSEEYAKGVDYIMTQLKSNRKNLVVLFNYF